MHTPNRAVRDRLIALSVGVCGVLAFSTTLSASSTVLTLGNVNYSNGSPSPQYGGVYVAPYPGAIEQNGNPASQLIVALFCLDGNKTDYFTQSYTGDVQPLSSMPADQLQSLDEAAFLASLLLTDARQQQITIGVSGVGANGLLTQTAPGPNGAAAVANFVQTVEGPISEAIWKIMGTQTTADANWYATDTLAQQFVAQAESAWTNGLADPSNPYRQWLNQSFMIFIPNGNSKDTQRYIFTVVPEPGTIVLFGTGALLIALGCARRLARRPR
jgi:hypothetical protein